VLFRSGFTDCFLQRGASRVYAIDTGYNQLVWKLRSDDRVTTLERSNALHLEPPAENKPSLVAIDLGWTPQRKCLPAAFAWLDNPETGRVITLIKPHYEASHFGVEHRGILEDDLAREIMGRVMKEIRTLGYRVFGETTSPIRGGKGKKKPGNTEYLALIAPPI